MTYLFKSAAFVFPILLILSCRSNNNKIQRKDAAYVLNLIDSITLTLGEPAKKLVSYTHTIDTNESPEIKIEKRLIDSMEILYNTLISTYGSAIKFVTNDNTIAKFKKVQTNFLILLNKGKEPWTLTIPVQIKFYRTGWNSLGNAEQEIFKTKESIMMNSAYSTLECAKILADLQDDLERKYHLELINEKYK